LEAQRERISTDTEGQPHLLQKIHGAEKGGAGRKKRKTLLYKQRLSNAGQGKYVVGAKLVESAF